MFICIKCSMKALLEDREPTIFEGSEADHIAKYHPDPLVTMTERRELENKFYTKIAKRGS